MKLFIQVKELARNQTLKMAEKAKYNQLFDDNHDVDVTWDKT